MLIIDDMENFTASCDYYAFGSDLNLGVNSFNIVHMNTGSVRANLNEFLLNLNKFKVRFHAIVLSETWLKSESDFVDVPRYIAYYSLRLNRRAGSVCL